MQKPLDPMSVERIVKTETPSASYVLRRRYGPARHVIAAASWLTVISLLLQPIAAFAADPTTGFNKDDAGPYDYNVTANWVGGAINGIWDASLTLTDNQTVTFGANTVLDHGWTFNYPDVFSITLKGTGGDRTVTLGGDIILGGEWSSVTVGSQTADQKLTIDLGPASRTFTGDNSNWLTFENPISSSSGAYGITVNGCIVQLNGANTYTGATIVNGGYLILGYGVSDTSKLSDTAALILSGGYVSQNVTADGKSHVDVVASTTINAGQSTAYGRGYATHPRLRMNEITRNAGGTLSIWESSRVDTDTGNGNGILGGWAVWGDGSDWQWAISADTASDTLIQGYNTASYVNIAGNWAGGIDTSNSRILTNTSVTLTDDRWTHSLKIQSSAAGKSLALGTETLTLTSGGLLFTGSHSFTISGTDGYTGLTAGSGSNYELIIHQCNQGNGDSAGALTISAVIGDNGSNPVSLTKSSGSMLSSYGANLILAGGVTHTYSGQTWLNSGFLQVDGTLSAGGAVNVNPVGNQTTLPMLCGSGTINRPVVLNPRTAIKGGAPRASSGTLTLGSDLTVPQGAIVTQGYRDGDGIWATGTIKIGGTATIAGTIQAPVFEMQSGSTLKGTGTLAAYSYTYTDLITWEEITVTVPGSVTLKSGATLRPGGSIGKLTAANVDISHEAGSTFAWEAKGYTTETGIGTAGTDYSQVAMGSGAKFTIDGGTKLRLCFPAGEDFSGSFWHMNKAWDIITGGSVASSGSIANGDLSVYVNNALYDGGDRTITGQGAFSTAYVADGILRLTWTACRRGTVFMLF